MVHEGTAIFPYQKVEDGENTEYKTRRKTPIRILFKLSRHYDVPEVTFISKSWYGTATKKRRI